MRIGIITINKINNYGADLQCFALFKVLQKKGYKPEIIDYLYVKNPKHIEEKESKPLIKFSFSSYIKWKLFKFAIKIIPFYKRGVYLNKSNNFESFYKNIQFSKTFKSISSLYKSNTKYDAYIVGSDQVWNPRTMTNLNPYFLDFAPKNSIKISYASSFGVDAIPEYMKSFYKTGLNNINYLSTREENGVRLIKNITNRNSVHVLDPTLLLTQEEWSTFAKPYQTNNSYKLNKDDYILIYTLDNNKYILDFASELKKTTGLDIIKINTHHFTKKNRTVDLDINDAGPSEFIYLFQNAKIIITNSFHGTCFSIIFKKDFFTIYSNKSNNNSRQVGLLTKLNIQNRLIMEDEDYSHRIKDITCNFEEVNQLLKNEIFKSSNFIDNSLRDKHEASEK